MLDLALATDFEPGTNRRDNAAGAAWSFLLGNLEVERLLCLGKPSEPSLTTLARLGDAVVVWCPNPRSRRKLQALVAAREWSHVAIEAMLPSPPERGPDGFDLVCLTADGVRTLHDIGEEVARRIPVLVRPRGQVYIELSGRRARRIGGQLLDGLERLNHRSVQQLWLTPRRGEVRAAAPVACTDVRGYLVSQGLHRPESSVGLIDRLGRVMAPSHTQRHPSHRTGVIVGPASDREGAGAPRFVARLAAEAGIDLSQHRWGLSARGRYDSRKVVFLFFASTAAAPEYVVKMTRQPHLNHRLENEHRALRLLQENEFGPPGTRPDVAFFGHHGGLAVLGQRALGGGPFDRHTTGSADCPYARAAIDWLVNLAVTTAVPAAPADVTASVGQLLDRYIRLYSPDAEERAYLADQVAALGPGHVPSVFQHGDPGTWNLLVSPPGRVAFLDWEAAEPEGMPLWDLFHFLRSYAVLAGRRSGVRDPLAAFAHQFLTDTPVGRLAAESVATGSDRIGLAAELTWPLVLTGWMHRALKEATRLRSDRLAGGHYVRLLRLCISERRSPHLDRMFPRRT